MNDSGQSDVHQGEGVIDPRPGLSRSGPARRVANRRVWAWFRVSAGVAIVAVVVQQVGAGPLLGGLSGISGGSVAAAVGLTLVTTLCSAWRWRIVARGLGVGLPLDAAVAAYYRSQFLNTVLPGGVLGDVHRGVSHGRDVGDVGRGLRAVAWERSAGQTVQVAVALVVLVVLPSPAQRFVPVLIACLLLAGLAVGLLARRPVSSGSSHWARAVRAARADVRDGLLAARSWPSVALASLLVVAGHTLTFVVAARTAGVDASLAVLLPLVMLVMLAMAVPTSVGGWGPREGAAAWLFGLAGLGVAQGAAAAVVYGVLVMAGSLPGLVVLVVTAASRRSVLAAGPAGGPDPVRGAGTRARTLHPARTLDPAASLPGGGDRG